MKTKGLSSRYGELCNKSSDYVIASHIFIILIIPEVSINHHTFRPSIQRLICVIGKRRRLKKLGIRSVPIASDGNVDLVVLLGPKCAYDG